MRRPFAQRAFTLIELMLAIFIAVMIIATVIPNMRGMSGERRLQETFEKFDELTRKAQLKAVSQQRSWSLVWGTGMISLRSNEATPEEIQAGGANVQEDFIHDENESYVLQRPASLLAPKDTRAEWTFWRSGTCEPVIVNYTGPAGTWTAQYNPLTGRGEMIDRKIK